MQDEVEKKKKSFCSHNLHWVIKRRIINVTHFHGASSNQILHNQGCKYWMQSSTLRDVPVYYIPYCTTDLEGFGVFTALLQKMFDGDTDLQGKGWDLLYEELMWTKSHLIETVFTPPGSLIGIEASKKWGIPKKCTQQKFYNFPYCKTLCGLVSM